MAYDPTCAETKAEIAKQVKAALAEQQEEHDTEIAGLKAKKTELLGKLKKAQAGEGGVEGGDPAELDRLEGELRKVRRDLSAAEGRATVAEEERDAARGEAAKEKTAATNLLTDQGLTSALAGVNVKPELLPAVTALLKGKVEIKEVAGERKAFAEGKPLGEFVKEWSQGDEGKHYVGAPVNTGGGGGKPPLNPQGGTKKISEMSLEERTALQREDPNKFNELVQAQREEQRSKARQPKRGF